MKKFMTIFCSVLIVSSTTAYAGTMGWKLSKDHRKYEWVNFTQTQPVTNNYQNSCKFPSGNNTNTPSHPTTQTTTEVVTEATTEATTESTTETTTQTTTPPSTNNTQSTNTQIASQVLELVNKERAKQNLSPLKLNTELTKVAQLKSEDMKNKNYFNHTSPTYGSPFDMMKQFGISYKNAGENIAKGQKTAEAVVTAWMNSEGHRKNILNKNFTDMGLGFAKSGSTPYWTQMFIQK